MTLRSISCWMIWVTDRGEGVWDEQTSGIPLMSQTFPRIARGPQRPDWTTLLQQPWLTLSHCNDATLLLSPHVMGKGGVGGDGNAFRDLVTGWGLGETPNLTSPSLSAITLPKTVCDRNPNTPPSINGPQWTFFIGPPKDQGQPCLSLRRCCSRPALHTDRSKARKTEVNFSGSWEQRSRPFKARPPEWDQAL